MRTTPAPMASSRAAWCARWLSAASRAVSSRPCLRRTISRMVAALTSFSSVVAAASADSGR